MEVLVVAKIQAQHWLRFLTCYFALRLCNLCLVIPGGVPPAALRRRGWELRFLWLGALFRLSGRLPAARAVISRCCRRSCRRRCWRCCPQRESAARAAGRLLLSRKSAAGQRKRIPQPQRRSAAGRTPPGIEGHRLQSQSAK